MGIRFLCPNGHKLNVKAYLAGERGICPQCDAKFLVPSESGGQAEALDDQMATEPQPTPAAEPTPIAAVPPTPPPAPEQPTAAPDPQDVWYVRSPRGDQYGPATIEVMRGWVDEGRVTPDCWVWRAGWPDWIPGSEALEQLHAPPTETPVAEPPVPAVESPIEENLVFDDKPSAAEVDVQLPNEPVDAAPASTNATTAYQMAQRNRQARARKVTLILGVVVVLLFAVLIGVLLNNK